MLSNEVLQALIFSAPMGCALVCIIVTQVDLFTGKKNGQEKSLRLFLSFAFMVGAMCWLYPVFQVTNQEACVRYFSTYAFVSMLDQVLIYRFVYFITFSEQSNRFSRLHFVTIFLFMVFIVVTDVIVPFDRKMEVAYGGDEGDHWYAILYRLISVTIIIYRIVYPILGIVRIRRYKHTIGDYYADAHSVSLNWFMIIQILLLISIPIQLYELLRDTDSFSVSWLSVLVPFLAFFIYPILCYNLLVDNYVTIVFEDDHLPNNTTEIDPKRFIQYLHDKKTFLNPRLLITDVASDLCTNRNYVSKFINNTYGMNFNQFINGYRLKELDRLRLSPDHKNDTTTELVWAAGFNSYRSYIRAKKAEYDKSILKTF